MSKRKQITAADLMAKLAEDPVWVSQQAVRESRREQRKEICEADEDELVKGIREVGYDIDSVYDLVNNTPHPVLKRRFLGPYRLAYPILLRHLKVKHHPRVREGIIRALTVNDGGPELEAALLHELEIETDETLRCALANALDRAVPHHRRKEHPQIKTILGY